MAFDYTNLYPDTSGNGGYTKSWNYTTVTDSIATCSASGYFNKVATRLGIGDNIVIARVDAFPTSTRTALVEYATLYVNGISGGVVTTTPSTTGLATTASPAFTGTPTAPTAAVDTNTTQLATTAMVIAQAASATPLINGVAAVGTSTRYARADHVHPTDTTRQPLLTAGQLPGTATNDSATAGNVGEYVESVVTSGSALSLTTGTAKTITSISLTAGDWDVDGIAAFLPANTTSVTLFAGSLSLVTNTLDVTPGRIVNPPLGTVVYNGGTAAHAPIPPYRFSLNATTTIFLVGRSDFTASTNVAFGIIRARRVR